MVVEVNIYQTLVREKNSSCNSSCNLKSYRLTLEYGSSNIQKSLYYSTIMYHAREQYYGIFSCTHADILKRIPLFVNIIKIYKYIIDI